MAEYVSTAELDDWLRPSRIEPHREEAKPDGRPETDAELRVRAKSAYIAIEGADGWERRRGDPGFDAWEIAMCEGGDLERVASRYGVTRKRFDAPETDADLRARVRDAYRMRYRFSQREWDALVARGEAVPCYILKATGGHLDALAATYGVTRGGATTRETGDTSWIRWAVDANGVIRYGDRVSMPPRADAFAVHKQAVAAIGREMAEAVLGGIAKSSAFDRPARSHHLLVLSRLPRADQAGTTVPLWRRRMNTIKVRSNWGYWDELDGEILKSGERLRIVWPNGEQTEEAVLIKREAIETQDMGNPWTMKIERAYVPALLRGVPVMVFICGLEAERVS